MDDYSIKLNRSSRFIKITAYFIFIICCQSLQAQLSDFTLQVSVTEESCTANGTINFTVSNTTPGATFIYKIYHLPDVTTPVAVLSATTFTGNVAGNYRVIAIQSLGELTNSQQQDVTIISTIDPLDYDISSTPEICGNDGKITIYVNDGVPVSYEIFSGPVIRPLQPSNIFDNLPGGAYLIRVFDDCGEGVATSYTLVSKNSEMGISDGFVVPSGCNNLNLYAGLYALPGSVFAVPMDVQITVNPPTGPPIVFNFDNISSPSPGGLIPYYPPPYTYNVIVVNRCGETFVRNNIPIVLNLDPDVDLGLTNVGCSGLRMYVQTSDMIGPVTYSFTTAPPGFNPLTFNPYFPSGTSYYNSTIPLPNGTYTIVATDSCGNTATATIVVNYVPPPPANLGVLNRPGCQIGYGSVYLSCSPGITTINLTSAPAAYTGAVPYNFTANLNFNNAFEFGIVPAGTYIFNTTDGCGDFRQTIVTVVGYAPTTTTVTISENCSSFNLALQHYTNAVQVYYGLQMLNSSNQWGHPETGFVGLPGIYNGQNTYPLNNGNNLNLQFSGVFRIVKRFVPYYTGGTGPPCIEIIYNFEYYAGPKIIDVYSFLCIDSTYDAIVIATGYAPLLYRITTQNGLPFFINNANSNVFLGLAPAVYNFQIEDACGNILNSVFDISNPSQLSITPTAFCSGNPASLSVPDFPFLSYQWWEGNNSTTILSTASSLQFPSFNPVTDNGTYHVRIFYTINPNSCIDFILDYQITIPTSGPNAGNGQTVSFCGPQGIIDLYHHLSNYDAYGTWQEITGSGTLTDNLWNTVNVSPGTYQFNYTVTGLCDVTDQSTVTIKINAIPETPTAFLEQTVCIGSPLFLLATAIPFGNYQWTGPNGFTSTEQNPVIANVSLLDSGLYSVHATAVGCASELSSVDVVVNPLPEFTISEECINNQYIITASPTGNSLDPETVSYFWTGPNNYASSVNPINITGGERGMYSLTVTSTTGCTTTVGTNILRTFCNVPLGISLNNDGKNDVFDLTGFDVTQLKIFNRYGRVVFEQNNYLDQWHGQDFNGRILPDATYYYYIKFASDAEKTGWVYLTK